jgi:hypothetical protein
MVKAKGPATIPSPILPATAPAPAPASGPAQAPAEELPQIQVQAQAPVPALVLNVAQEIIPTEAAAPVFSPASSPPNSPSSLPELPEFDQRKDHYGYGMVNPFNPGHIEVENEASDDERDKPTRPGTKKRKSSYESYITLLLHIIPFHIQIYLTN